MTGPRSKHHTAEAVVAAAVEARGIDPIAHDGRFGGDGGVDSVEAAADGVDHLHCRPRKKLSVLCVILGFDAARSSSQPLTFIRGNIQ